LLTHNLKHLPVVRDGTPVGMVARHDVLKLLAGELWRGRNRGGPEPEAGDSR